MSGRKYFLLLLVLGTSTLSVVAQTGIELIPAAGMGFASNVRYDRSTGHVNPAFLFSFSFLYHPSPWVSLELSYLNQSPLTYLQSADEPSVKVYTTAKIKDEKLLGGINFTVPGRRFRPYLGALAGLTYVSTKTPLNTGTVTRFAWSLQSGLDVSISSLIGIRYRIALVQTTNVPNNSAYFNVGKDGTGFPSFALGDPSSANINQLNMGLGVIFHFVPRSRANNNPAGNPRNTINISPE